MVQVIRITIWIILLVSIVSIMLTRGEPITMVITDTIHSHTMAFLEITMDGVLAIMAVFIMLLIIGAIMAHLTTIITGVCIRIITHIIGEVTAAEYITVVVATMDPSVVVRSEIMLTTDLDQIAEVKMV